MKIAVDSSFVKSGHSVRGIGFYTKELIKYLKNYKKEGFDIKIINLKEKKYKDFDLVHFTSFNPYFFSIPFVKKTKTLVTIHDVAPLIFPEHYPPGIRGEFRFIIQKYLIKKVDGVLTISNTSKRDIVKYLGINPQKVHVVYLAPWNMFKKLDNKNFLDNIRNKYRLPSKFVMFLGDVNYNKNLATLIKACKIAKTPLVIVGKHASEIENLGTDLWDLRGPKDWIRFILNKPHPEEAHYTELQREFRSNPGIIRTGLVPDKDLVAIFNLATVYCQPSYYEGYGLPNIQALACGVPVVASDIPTHRELLGDAALYANPRKTKEFVKLIKNIFSDRLLSEKMIKKGYIQVKKYSWERFITESVNVYKKVLK